jgi:succinate dehydrogenase/fumarate reductase-like Fe-S protein
MAEFTLRLRRYDPESGQPPYWAEYNVDLEPHRSVLEGILQAKNETRTARSASAARAGRRSVARAAS